VERYPLVCTGLVVPTITSGCQAGPPRFVRAPRRRGVSRRTPAGKEDLWQVTGPRAVRLWRPETPGGEGGRQESRPWPGSPIGGCPLRSRKGHGGPGRRKGGARDPRRGRPRREVPGPGRPGAVLERGTLARKLGPPSSRGESQGGSFFPAAGWRTARSRPSRRRPSKGGELADQQVHHWTMVDGPGYSGAEVPVRGSGARRGPWPGPGVAHGTT